MDFDWTILFSYLEWTFIGPYNFVVRWLTYPSSSLIRHRIFSFDFLPNFHDFRRISWECRCQPKDGGGQRIRTIHDTNDANNIQQHERHVNHARKKYYLICPIYIYSCSDGLAGHRMLPRYGQRLRRDTIRATRTITHSANDTLREKKKLSMG